MVVRFTLLHCMKDGQGVERWGELRQEKAARRIADKHVSASAPEPTPQPSVRQRRARICYNCRGRGHIAEQCPEVPIAALLEGATAGDDETEEECLGSGNNEDQSAESSNSNGDYYAAATVEDPGHKLIALRDQLAMKTGYNLIALRDQLSSIQMEACEPAGAFIGRVNNLISLVEALENRELTDSEKVSSLLKGLPPAYSMVVNIVRAESRMVVRDGQCVFTPPYSAVCDSILYYETELKNGWMGGGARANDDALLGQPGG